MPLSDKTGIAAPLPISHCYRPSEKTPCPVYLPFEPFQTACK
ncbi:hypothetical protein [Neisseria sp. 74A18]|nr:hypothetical protein [Neisseria sp. 74A18]